MSRWYDKPITWKKDSKVVREIVGGSETLSQENQLKVEIDMHGNVFGVSFRGRYLPFYWTINYGRVPDMVRETYKLSDVGSIDSIVFEAKDVA